MQNTIDASQKSIPELESLGYNIHKDIERLNFQLQQAQRNLSVIDGLIGKKKQELQEATRKAVEEQIKSKENAKLDEEKKKKEAFGIKEEVPAKKK